MIILLKVTLVENGLFINHRTVIMAYDHTDDCVAPNYELVVDELIELSSPDEFISSVEKVKPINMSSSKRCIDKVDEVFGLKE
jgi:energy-converting hydrogenase A subunit M